MRSNMIALGACLLLVEAAFTSAYAAIDSNVTGLWVPVYHRTAQVSQSEFDFFPNGTIIQHNYALQADPVSALYLPVVTGGRLPYLQWIIDGVALPAVKGTPGTGSYTDGKFTMKFSSGTSNGTYQLSANNRIMTISFDNIVLKLKRIADSNGVALPQALSPQTAQTGPLDDNLTGLWLESIPMPTQGYTQDTLYEIHPNGNFIDHIQHITPQTTLQLNSSSYDINTYTYTVQSLNGRFMLYSTSPTFDASYVFSPDKQEMIVEYDTDSYGFLFERIGQIGTDDSMSASGGNIATPEHYVDPQLVRVWYGSLQNPGDAFLSVSLIEWHANGDFVYHVRHTTAGQSPLAVPDVQTITGHVDAFGGRFLIAESEGNRESGVYSVSGNTLTMAWDSDKTNNLAYELFGYFDSKGNIVPLTLAK